MSKLFMFEKPLGMRDTLPLVYETKQTVRNLMQKTIQNWGYQFLETPALEYYETVGQASAILDQQLFKLLDQQGHTLVMRPDMTAPIARVAATKLRQQAPIRLAYLANVYRAQQREGGRPAEFEQIGVECIGSSSISTDAELIALLVESLKNAGLEEFQISLGHIGIVQNVFMKVLGTKERAAICRKFLYEKNYVGYREHVKSLRLSSIDKRYLLQLLDLRGGKEVLEIVSEMVEENRLDSKALQELVDLWRGLIDFGVEQYVTFDLTLISHMSYYTGILFEVYANQIGFPLGSGGRYDNFLEKFEWKTPATGFAIRIDRLMEALGEPSSSESFHCLLFSPERRKEAIEKAKRMRGEGLRVVLQEIGGIEDLDLFASHFKEVEYLLGSRKETES
ncbi:ATP phosphoribosyltransferase regulatory subunit [Peribacillus alkalitolerans]|uniref:ATP phosphoribosyltransferase regulatory subunit n=1 Tax=Peribacillus alkalitolerans TaxID=1550385 RepID=UPI0013D03A28|nr:ATP phosphoribosyltransferase regulatory subunit [Peribacillus alkalitolerans]